MVHALLRVDIGDSAFNQTIDACNKAWELKKVPRDFFAAHSFILQHVGQQNQLRFEENLPVINHHQDNNFSRVNFKDQWSSHPTFIERKENLEKYGHTLIPDTRSAWTLFQNIHELRTQLTGIVYRDIPKDEIDSSLDDHQFESLIQQDIKNDSFPDFYNGYYDYRRVHVFDVEDVLHEQSSFNTLKEVFNEKVMGLPEKLRFLRNDIAVLQDIETGNIDANTFDFDGEKYKRKDASRVINQLQEEAARLEDELVKSDKSLFKYFYANASALQAKDLKKEYGHYFDERLEADVFFKTVNEMMEPLWPVYRGENVTIENALNVVQEHKDVLEPQFKEQLRNWMPRFTTNQDLQSSIEKFIATDYQYFHEDSFFDNELQDLHRLMSDSWDEVNEYLFVRFRKISEKQLEIIG